jgi:hypothetical protein
MFGEIVGTGAQATVYAKEEYAVKLYRDGYPKRNVSWVIPANTSLSYKFGRYS